VLVVPVPVPERKDIVVPHFLNDFSINSTVVLILKFLALFLTPLNQYCPQISDPFASLLGGSSF
jgi:hypothetical protein